MSQLIRSDVAAETRFSVVAATLRHARAQGGWVAEEAERYLADVHTLATTNAADRVSADQALTHAREQLPFAERAVHLVVGRIHDALWNDLGRPAADPRFVVLFPAGTRTGTMGARDGHPAALRALAARLETVGHGRLAKDELQAAAAEIRETATALATAIDQVDAAAEVAAHHQQLEQALARVAYLQLAALKRMLVARGLRGPEVDQVLPPTKRPRRRSTVPVPVPDAAPVVVEVASAGPTGNAPARARTPAATGPVSPAGMPATTGPVLPAGPVPPTGTPAITRKAAETAGTPAATGGAVPLERIVG